MNIPKPFIRLCRVLAIAAAIPLVPYWLGLFWKFVLKLLNLWDDEILHHYREYDPFYEKFTLWFGGFAVTFIVGLVMFGLYSLIKWIFFGSKDDSGGSDDSGDSGIPFGPGNPMFGGMDMNITTPY